MATRLETLNTRLQQYIECEAAILSGAQEYTISTRHLRRADLPEIADNIKYLEKEIAAQGNFDAGKGRNRVIGIIPRDF